MSKTKSRLCLVDRTEHPKSQVEVVPVEPCITSRISTKHLDFERGFFCLLTTINTFDARVCFVDHVDYKNEKAFGVYKASSKRYMIFIDKKIKGIELIYLLARELGYMVIHEEIYKGSRYWKIPGYRKELANKAISYANDIVNIFTKKKVAPTPTQVPTC